uniref:Holliday junction branch migration protein RuvA n=1 Tax=Tessaracoccus timonensis TaxID=2161816 RepID=UPI000D55BBE9|nr:Holliday junction branch migration protein RuvA [Tessaracoccus timonensis]
MIAQLTGQVTYAGATSFIIEVSGVGFRANTNANTAATLRVGEVQTVHTSLVVREDSLTMWGFATPAERDAFELVQTASGVGPKVAAAMLSVFSPGELRQVIASEDVKRLTSVPGIGPKGAQKIILELKDKVLLLSDDDAPAPVRVDDDALWKKQVKEGLEGLGWSSKEAQSACDHVAPLVEEDPNVPIATLMRAALSRLAKR